MFIKILITIGYILVGYGYSSIYALFHEFMANPKNLRKSFTLLVREVEVLIGFMPLVLFPLLLSGHIDLSATLILLLSVQIGIIISIVAGLLLGFTPSDQEEFALLSFYAATAQNLKNKFANPLSQAIRGLIGLGYFALVINTLFRYETYSDIAVFLIFKATLIFVFFSGLVTQLFTVPLLLVAEDLHEDVRRYMLIDSMSGIVSIGVYLGLTLEIFGITGTGYTLSLNQFHLALSPVFALILSSYFLGIIALPYLVGSQRARRMRLKFLTRKIDYNDRIERALSGYVSNPEDLSSKLTGVVEEINKEQEALTVQRPIMAVVQKIEETMMAEETLEAESESLYQGYEVLRHRGVYKYSNFLTDQTTSLTNLLEGVQSGNVSATTLDSYKQQLESDEKGYQEELEREKRSHSPLYVVLNFVWAAIGSVMLSEVIGQLVGLISQPFATP